MVNKEKMEIDKDVMYDLYVNKKMSFKQIADKFGGTKSQVAWLIDLYEIPPRTHAEAKKVYDNKEMNERVKEGMEKLEDKVADKQLVATEFSPVVVKNMLIPVPVDNKCREAVLTLVISDLHIGDSCHLPESYWSSVDNAVEVIRNINGLYKTVQLNIVLNGDITNGVDVYRYQELRNLIQRGHWQVFVTEMILKDTVERLKKVFAPSEMVLVRGTHDTLSNNLVLYLKRVLPGKVTYLSHGGVYNIAGPLGTCNVLFMHGRGSASSPITYSSLNDVSSIVDMYRQRGMIIDRVCTAHMHWLSSGFIVNNLYWDTTGGYQKWEYTINQRPCGLILYLYAGGESVSIPIRPKPDVEMAEKTSPRLEYTNFTYYGNLLLKHLKEIEGIED